MVVRNWENPNFNGHVFDSVYDSNINAQATLLLSKFSTLSMWDFENKPTSIIKKCVSLGYYFGWYIDELQEENLLIRLNNLGKLLYGIEGE